MKNIKIVHKGEDYYGVQYGDIYGEVTLLEGEQIKVLTKMIKNILKNSFSSNSFESI